jgi:hypothetical protein
MKRFVTGQLGRLALALASGALATVTPAPAAAQAILRGDPEDYRSSRSWALELRFGAFRPDVDAELDAGKVPYETYFGKGRGVMTQLELDYQLFQRFGSLAVAGSIGIFRKSAKSFVAVAPGQSTTDRSGDDTKLSLIPLAAMLVYRMDVPALRWGIPLVPYVKAGLNYTIWSIYDGDGRVARYDGGGRGRGGTVGWQAAAGLSLLLDFLDPGAARELDGEVGVNHTHLFFEVTRVSAPAFGKRQTLRVGDSTWFAGLMFEF